jgi:hypothetical protein
MLPVKRSSRRVETLGNFLASKGLYVGVGLYLLSFFLPAVVDVGGPMRGWVCAWLSLWAWSLREPSSAVPLAGSVLAFFGGLINPLAILYAVLRGRNKAHRLRSFLHNAILLCIPFTWLSLLVLHMGVRVGHVLWITGLLMMTLSEAATRHDFRFTRYTSVFAVLVLGLCGYHWVVTPMLAPITDRDEFFYSVAVHFKAPQACSKIGHYDSGGFSEQPGYQIAYLQSRCYYDLAQTVNDLKLCDQVRPLTLEGQDGARYSSAACRNNVPDPVIQVSAYLKQEDFVQLMEAAGFEKAAVDFRQVRFQDKAPFLDLYEQVRQDARFVASLQRIPGSYDWRSRPRPAIGPEYLLSMLGTDASDEGLCFKISPSANYQYPDGKAFSLRSACLFHVVFYSHKNGCIYFSSIQNPPMGQLVSEYDSLESCTESLRTERYPDWGEPPDAKPIYFPDRQSFQAALDELGYTPRQNVTKAPKPTFDDYIEFFLHVADGKRPEMQTEFVRRVMSLK